MCRRSTNSLALFKAFGTPALGQTQDIQVAEVPFVTWPRIRSFSSALAVGEVGGTRGEPIVGQLAIQLGVLVSGCGCGFALNPELDISQSAHTARTIRDGFFKPLANSITQTPDRYLGLATEEPHTKARGGLHAENRDASGRKWD